MGLFKKKSKTIEEIQKEIDESNRRLKELDQRDKKDQETQSFDQLQTTARNEAQESYKALNYFQKRGYKKLIKKMKKVLEKIKRGDEETQNRERLITALQELQEIFQYTEEEKVKDPKTGHQKSNRRSKLL